MSRRRIAALTALALVTLLVAFIGLERSIERGNDFDNLYDSGVSVWHEGQLLREKGTLRYPPTFQIFMAPFGAFPIEGAAFLWLLVNLGAYASLPWAFARLSGTPPSAQGWAWFGVAPFVVSNVTLGQSGPLLLALSTLGVLEVARARAVLGGAVLTAAGLLKVFPGAVMAVPLMLGRARGALAGAALAAVLGVGAVSFAVGPRAGATDLVNWLDEIRTEQNAHQMIHTRRSLRYNNQGLAVTMVRSLTFFDVNERRAAKGVVQVARLPRPVVFGLYYAIVAALVAGIAACAQRARRAPRTRHFLGLYALTTPAMLAISPIVWTHYFLWLLPPFVYLADRKRLLQALGLASLAAIFSTPARALGFHMGLGLVLFVLVALRLWRETAESDAASRLASPPEGGRA